MILGKSNADQELKSLIGFIHNGLKFDNLKPYARLAESSLKKTISDQIFAFAETYYKGSSFDPNGTTVKDVLVVNIQMCVALTAYRLFAPSNDLSHTNSGRSIYVEENIKPAFEWMIEKDNANLDDLVNSFTDYLLEFLDKNIEDNDLKIWKDTDVYKSSHSLLILNANEFSKYFDINDSRRLFLVMVPSISRIQSRVFQSILKPELLDKFIFYNQKKEDITLTEAEKEILEACKLPICLMSVSEALKTLSEKVFPDRIVSTYLSTLKTERSSSFENRIAVSKTLINVANSELQYLQRLVTKYYCLAAGLPIPEITIASIDPHDKIVSI